MEQTLLITVLQLLVFISYVGYVWYKFGVLEAISTSAKKFNGNDKLWFLAFCWSLGFLNLFQGMEGWGFGTMAGLMFTGITFKFYENIAHGKLLHIVAAAVAIILGFVGLGVLHDMWWLMVLYGFIIALILVDPYIYINSKKLWWVEVFGFLIIMFGYYIR